MTKLLFDFQDMSNEVDAFAKLAERYISPQSRYVLPNLRGTLDTYRNQKTDAPYDWTISQTNPLRTETSLGKYEVGGGGGLPVFAEISAKWRIQRIPLPRRPQHAERFRLVGIASTKVRLLTPLDDGGAPQEVAMWRMEVGDTASPGCHFHVQVMGEHDAYPFPRSVPVPRLPGLLLTPASVIEFVLGELFQDDWLKHIANDSANLQRWAPIQKRRFESLIRWQLEVLERGGSPWAALKSTKPREELFVSAGAA